MSRPRRGAAPMSRFAPTQQLITRVRSMHPTRSLALFFIGVSLALAQSQSVATGPQADAKAPWLGTTAWFRKTFFYDSVHVTLRDPTRLRDFVVEGQLNLSLKNYLDLVMANSTDIEIQRLQLEYPKDAIQRAFSIFDPYLSSGFSATRSKSPTTSDLQGASVLSTLVQPFNLNLSETLPTGTQVNASVSTAKSSTNSGFYFYNPAFSTGLTLGFTQPLLRGRGSAVTHLPITIAKAQRRAADFAFRSQLIGLLSSAENAYWDLVSAREHVKVQQQSLDLADQALKRSRREVELGATSPLEIFQPEQQYATAKLNLAQVEFQVRQAEDILRRQIGMDLVPDLRNLPIVLTESVTPQIDETPIERDKLVDLALRSRPDLVNIRVAGEVTDLQIRSAVESLKPQLNLSASYTTSGIGGDYYPTTGGAVVPGGMTDAFGQMFGFGYPTWQFSLSLNLPLRDRAGAANLADSVAGKRINLLTQRTTEQQIRQDVLTAITQLESSRASVKLAQIAVDYAVKRVDADQQRYDLGVITVFFLLSSQTDLTTARSNLVDQFVQYRRNVLNLQQRLGTLLADKGIVVQ
jgi:outer membrane protein